MIKSLPPQIIPKANYQRVIARSGSLKIIMLVLLAIAANFSPSPTSAADETPRPNIILIIADDLDQQLGTIDHMPNLQSLLPVENNDLAWTIHP